MSDYETSDVDIPFTTEPKGYLYEPEYIDTELRQMELEQRRETEKRSKLKLDLPLTEMYKV